MKKNNVLIILSLLVSILFIRCDGDIAKNENPDFEGAKVSNDAKNEIVVDFSEPVFTSKIGFEITVDDKQLEIIEIKGSGSSRIVLIVESNIQTNQIVTISYSSAEGDAADNEGKELRSFTNRTVNNLVAKLDLLVSLFTVPPEMKENEDAKVWLILRTDEDADVWAWDHKSAVVNETLTATTTKTPFDLIVYITDDPDWRAHKAFTNGYYASQLNLTSDDKQLKVITWESASDISGTDMGHLIELNQNQENTSFEKAYTLLTDSTDYLESNIETSESLWYKFYGVSGNSYNIYLYDYYIDDDNFTGAVEAVVMDRYKIEIDNIEPVLSGHSQTIEGKDENIFLEVKVSKRGGIPGNFQIQVVKQ